MLNFLKVILWLYRMFLFIGDLRWSVWRWNVMMSAAAAAAKSLQLCPTLCDPIDGSPLGSPVPGILQARTLEWVAISFSNAWKWKVKVKLLSHVQLLVDPMDCSPPGSSVHGIFQARVLEWGAIAFSFPDLYHLPKFAQTHVHWVGDTIQSSQPLWPPSPTALNLSQYQGLFQWVNSSNEVARVLEFQL